MLEMREHGTSGETALPASRPSVQLPAGIERKRRYTQNETKYKR
jgi:hypothetical protein